MLSLKGCSIELYLADQATTMTYRSNSPCKIQDNSSSTDKLCIRVEAGDAWLPFSRILQQPVCREREILCVNEENWRSTDLLIVWTDANVDFSKTALCDPAGNPILSNHRIENTAGLHLSPEFSNSSRKTLDRKMHGICEQPARK